MDFIIKHFTDLSTEELYLLLQLRIEVFVLEQNCPYQDLDGKDLECYHVMAFENKQLIGCTRLVPPGVSYDGYSSIGRVVSHPDFRRKGIGRAIMEESMRQCEMLFPGYNIKISAQSYLIPFYESMYFEIIGPEYLEDNIPHQAMIKHLIQFGQN